MTTTPQAAQNPLLKRCYTMSEPHLSGYRVVIGFERLEDAQDAHEYIAKLQATQEPGRVFPPRIMELLEQVADRNPGTTKGPWEDAQGLPMQDDADAAISWIKARSVATQEPVQAVELPDEREAFEATVLKDNPHAVLTKSRNGCYQDDELQAMWWAWQARSALSARKPLNSAQIRGMAIQEEFLLVCDSLEDLTCIVREVELAHGIGLEVKP